MKWLLLASLLVPSPPTQSEADKLEAALKKFGDRNYSIFVNGEKVGACELNSRVEKDGGQAVAVLEERQTWSWREESIETVTETVSLDRLRLVSSQMTLKREFLSVIIDGRKAVLKVDGLEQTLDVSAATVGELGVVRLVCAAEQKEGATFKVDVVSLAVEQFQPGHSFRCLGREQVEIGGKKVNAFKWEDKGEWKLAKKAGEKDRPDTWRINHTYWVSPDGYLLRFDNGDTVWVLDAK